VTVAGWAILSAEHLSLRQLSALPRAADRP